MLTPPVARLSLVVAVLPLPIARLLPVIAVLPTAAAEFGPPQTRNILIRVCQWLFMPLSLPLLSNSYIFFVLSSSKAEKIYVQYRKFRSYQK